MNIDKSYLPIYLIYYSNCISILERRSPSITIVNINRISLSLSFNGYIPWNTMYVHWGLFSAGSCAHAHAPDTGRHESMYENEDFGGHGFVVLHYLSFPVRESQGPSGTRINCGGLSVPAITPPDLFFNWSTTQIPHLCSMIYTVLLLPKLYTDLCVALAVDSKREP